jgi:hypothetical protein
MTAIFAFDPGKSEMKVSTIQIFVNHSHDISAPIAVPGFIHIINSGKVIHRTLCDSISETLTP